MIVVNDFYDCCQKNIIFMPITMSVITIVANNIAIAAFKNNFIVFLLSIYSCLLMSLG